jgi:hypothetical protein
MAGTGAIGKSVPNSTRPFFAPSPAVGFAAEIGDEIVSMLERRLVALRAELEKLGGEDHGQAHD